MAFNHDLATQLQSSLNTFATDFNSNDAAGMDSLFDQDATMFPPSGNPLVGLAAISALFARVNGTGANMTMEVLDADYVHKGTGGSDLTYVYALISYSSSVSRGSGVSVWRSSGANGAFAIYYFGVSTGSPAGALEGTMAATPTSRLPPLVRKVDPVGAPSSSVSDALLKGMQTMQSAFNSNDPNALGNMFYSAPGFEPALVISSMATPIVGSAAIAQFYSTVFANGGASSTILGLGSAGGSISDSFLFATGTFITSSLGTAFNAGVTFAVFGLDATTGLAKPYLLYSTVLLS